MAIPAADLVAQLGISPFDALDAEAARIDYFYSGLDADGWSAPTRCAGWDRRALLVHLCATEDDTRARLAGRVSQQSAEARADAVARRADLPPQELLRQWQALSHTNRHDLRERGVDGTIDTSAGDYPVGRHAFYLASELATYADDAGVVEPVEDRPARLRWRAAFARSVVAETAEGVEVVPDDGGDVLVRPGDVRLSAQEFVAAAADRLPADHPLPPQLRRALTVLA